MKHGIYRFAGSSLNLGSVAFIGQFFLLPQKIIEGRFVTGLKKTRFCRVCLCMYVYVVYVFCVSCAEYGDMLFYRFIEGCFSIVNAETLLSTILHLMAPRRSDNFGKYTNK